MVEMVPMISNTRSTWLTSLRRPRRADGSAGTYGGSLRLLAGFEASDKMQSPIFAPTSFKPPPRVLLPSAHLYILVPGRSQRRCQPRYTTPVTGPDRLRSRRCRDDARPTLPAPISELPTAVRPLASLVAALALAFLAFRYANSSHHAERSSTT